MKITEKKIADSTAKVEVHIPVDRIDHVKEEVVDEMIKNISVKGFRQGKAPKGIAEKSLEPEKLNSHIISHLLNEAVVEVVKVKKYRTLGRPVLEKLETAKNGEVLLILNFPLYPEFKLGKYQEKVKKIKGERKIEEIYKALLESIKIEVSPLLIDEESRYAFERLEDQVKRLNITLEKYFESVKKTKEEVMSEYQKNALESIKLDLILLEIANEQKLEVGDKELQTLMEMSGAKPQQTEQLRSVIMRRKTVDYLNALK